MALDPTRRSRSRPEQRTTRGEQPCGELYADPRIDPMPCVARHDQLDLFFRGPVLESADDKSSPVAQPRNPHRRHGRGRLERRDP